MSRAKELVLLKEVVRAKILSSNNQGKMKSISLIEYITDPSRQHPSKVLDNVLEVFKKEFFASLSEDELKKIKVAIERELENKTDLMEQQNLKKLIGSIGELIENGVKAESSMNKINRIETTIATKNQSVKIDNIEDDNLSETDSVDSNVTMTGDSFRTIEKISSTNIEAESKPIEPIGKTTLDMGDESESRKNAAKKGMKFGSIGGAITALVVGLGLYFGTGAALTVLPTIIGIALVAALVIGATIFAITYDVLKPDSKIDTFYKVEGVAIKQEANTAAR